MTFGVVLFTLLVPGLSVEWLLKLLSVTPREERSKQYNNEANLLRVYQKEMQELVKFKEEWKNFCPWL